MPVGSDILLHDTPLIVTDVIPVESSTDIVTVSLAVAISAPRLETTDVIVVGTTTITLIGVIDTLTGATLIPAAALTLIVLVVILIFKGVMLIILVISVFSENSPILLSITPLIPSFVIDSNSICGKIPPSIPKRVVVIVLCYFKCVSITWGGC